MTVHLGLFGPRINRNPRHQPMAVPNLAFNGFAHQRPRLTHNMLVRSSFNGLGAHESIHAVKKIDSVRDHDTFPPEERDPPL